MQYSRSSMKCVCRRELIIVNKLSNAMAEVAEDPEFQKVLTNYYAQAYYRDSETTVSEDTELVNLLKEFFAGS